MKPELRFETKRMRACSLGEESSVPDIAGSAILQNDLEFDLDEEDEIFEAYGTRKNAYPYRQYQAYSRELKERRVKTAVLENDCLRAVFLPEYGGRLWELWDKRRQENLLYTNDVIRFSNLAACNAWFSGGVEWNPGIIGHTPFTVRPLYTARLEEAGIPVLRMYEYERIRGVEYQMDFWLEEKDACLNCRMRIVNSGSRVVPMYWWSNMAVPEYAGGRIVVPAKEAYTSREAKVSKVSIPQVEGVDITRYENIPSQTDYFFNIPEESPKFIANLNQEGYGLLQYSTKRLRGRKLFSWGHKEGADRWQEFLTEDAGRYVEIQAGLGKTQYGCIPMPPHSAWEWMERYGSIQVQPEELRLGFEELSAALAGKVAARIQEEQLEGRLKKTRTMARRKGIGRMDLCIETPRIKYEALSVRKPQESSKEVRKRVVKTRNIQNMRYAETGITSNALLGVRELEKYCQLGDNEERLMKRAYLAMGLTARTYHKILRVARTIADMEESERIREHHLKEAISYRTIDKKYWGR